MDIFSAYATDEVAEVEGRYFPLDKDTQILVARTGNPNYVKALRQRMKANAVDPDDNSDATEALVTKIIIETMAETILLGWKGSMKFKGQDLPYSQENAIKVLELKGFRRKVSDIADKMESFRIKEEEAQGNA